MEGEILLIEKTVRDMKAQEEEPFNALEQRIKLLLSCYQEILKENEALLQTLLHERERAEQLEKRLEILSQDREKVKVRIDQLLLRLKNLEI